MYPPVFDICDAEAEVQSVFGLSPCRLYEFGYATGKNGGAPVSPYAVWQVVGGGPENYLGTLPDADTWTVQFDVYAKTSALARSGAQALRDAIEPVAHITSWRGESREPDTNLYRYSFDVDWITHREASS